MTRTMNIKHNTPRNSFSVLEDQAGNARNDPQPVISEQNLNDAMQIPPNIQIPSPNNEGSIKFLL